MLRTNIAYTDGGCRWKVRRSVAVRRKPNSVPRLRPLTRASARRRSFLWPRHCWRDQAAYPETLDGPSSNVSLFGFAPCGVLPAVRVATNAVRSYRTFSPLLAAARGSKSRERRRAVYFLCHFPSSCPDRALPGALPCGVRTFLSPPPLSGLRRSKPNCDLLRRSTRRRTIVWRTATVLLSHGRATEAARYTSAAHPRTRTRTRTRKILPVVFLRNRVLLQLLV